MIEFRSDKGAWWCHDAGNNCYELAAAIVEDGRWWFVAACQNELHVAEALADHAERVASDDSSMCWADVNYGKAWDGKRWDEVA